MSLESASYISQLNSANPPGGDPVAQAAAQIRLVKSVLKSTFPNINSPVNSTPLQLNSPIPTGTIMMWYSSLATIPSGWGYCNGTSYSRSDGTGSITAPDLRGYFMVGAGAAYAVGATGGADSVTPTITVDDHTLSTSELPAHSHPVTDPGHGHSVTDPGHTHTYQKEANGIPLAGGGFASYEGFASTNTGSSTTGVTIVSNTTGITTTNTGGGNGHNHTASSSVIDNRPVYKAMVYIMKL